MLYRVCPAAGSLRASSSELDLPNRGRVTLLEPRGELETPLAWWGAALAHL